LTDLNKKYYDTKYIFNSTHPQKINSILPDHISIKMLAQNFVILQESTSGVDLLIVKTSNSCLDCVFKKCCEKYKNGKRCKNCPKRK